MIRFVDRRLIVAACLYAAASCSPDVDSSAVHLHWLTHIPIAGSPDGELVVATEKGSNDFSLVVRSLATGKIVAVDRSRNPQLDLSWSPNGREIAFFECHEGDRRFQLYVFDVRTGARRAIPSPFTHSAALAIRWAPSGTKLAYVATDRARNRLVVAETTGHAGYRITPFRLAPQSDFAWAPDGDSLVVVSDLSTREVWTIEEGRLTPRSAVRLSAFGEIRSIDWLRESWVAAFRSEGTEYFRLATIDGHAGEVRISDGPPGDVDDVHVLPSGEVVYQLQHEGDASIWAFSVRQNAHRRISPPQGLSIIRGWQPAAGVIHVLHTPPNDGPALLSVRLDREETKTIDHGFDASPGTPPESLSIASASVRVPAFLWRAAANRSSRSCALILLHGSQVQWRRARDALVQLGIDVGCHVLALNPRGSAGYGATFEHASLAESVADVLAARSFLVRQVGFSPDRVFLVGSSFGAFLATQALIREPRGFGGAVLLSLPAWPTASSSAVRFPPVLAFHGRHDDLSSPTDTHDLLAAMFGRFAPTTERGSWRVFPDEGHQFHRLKSWMEVEAGVRRLVTEAP